MFLRSHTLYICTILLKLTFLSFVKNKFSLSNDIMAILVNETVAKRIITHHSVNNDVFVPRNKTRSSVICSLLLLLASITMI